MSPAPVKPYRLCVNLAVMAVMTVIFQPSRKTPNYFYVFYRGGEK